MNDFLKILLFLQVLAHENAVRVLDFANDDNAMKASDTVDVTQRIEHKVLIVFHIVGIYLNLEVVIASRVVTFRDLVYSLNDVHKLLDELVGVLFKSDVA